MDLQDQAEARRNFTAPRYTSLLIALVLCLVCVVVGIFARNARAAARENASVEASNLSVALAQSIARSVSLLDLLLTHIDGNLANNPRVMFDAQDLKHLISFEPSTRTSFLGPIVVVDSAGHVAASSTEHSPLSFDTDALIRVAAQAKLAGFRSLVSRPFRLQRNGPLLIGLSHRITTADGAFAGIVIGTLRCDYFRDLFSQMQVRPHTVFALLGSDGTELMHEPSGTKDLGALIAPSELTGRLANVRQGEIEASSGSGGQARLIHFQRVDGLPMIQVVAFSTSAIYAGWWRKAIFIGAFMFSSCAAIAWLAVAGRKQNEARLREAHDRAQASAATNAAILGQLAEGVIVTDAAGRITFVNDAAASIHGVARLDVEPSAYSDTYHLYTEDGQRYIPRDLPLARAVRGDTVRDARWRIKRPHDSEVLAIGSAQPLRDAERRQIGAVLTLRDDTAREAAERSLRESEARLRTLADNMPSGIIFQLATNEVGVERRFLYLSRSFERLTGISADAVLANADVAYALIAPAYRRALVTAEAFAARAGTPIDVEIQLERADTGELRWCRIISVARELPDRSLIWDGLQIDITDQKRAEEALRELNATLAERVAERTRDADASRLQAEAASQAKSEFLATMSHEIRTPLNGILGYTDLLLEEPSIGPAVRLHGERIRSAGSALLTIVDDVLDFSRIDAGHIELKSEPFSPNDLFDEAMSIVRPSAERKGLHLRGENVAALPTLVSGDRDRLRQVLLNLLNNAIKFTRAGTVALVVDVVAADADLARLHVSVRDTGIGIPTSKRHLLFERFSQVDGTVQREFGGTGLGLAISKRLIEHMGGTIGADSDFGRGSTFWFEVDLPLAAPAKIVDAPKTPIRSGRALHLLLVEDVALNQELARAVLESGGYDVDTVSSGADAIAAVQAKTYDLVLMDVQMPGIDGITATRMIRALDNPAALTPIVAMTANVLPHQVAEFRAAGMHDHVGKPFKRDVLFAAIERWAGGRDGSAADRHRSGSAFENSAS